MAYQLAPYKILEDTMDELLAYAVDEDTPILLWFQKPGRNVKFLCEVVYYDKEGEFFYQKNMTANDYRYDLQYSYAWTEVPKGLPTAENPGVWESMTYVPYPTYPPSQVTEEDNLPPYGTMCLFVVEGTPLNHFVIGTTNVTVGVITDVEGSVFKELNIPNAVIPWFHSSHWLLCPENPEGF